MSTQTSNPLDSFEFVRIGKVRSLIDRLSDAASSTGVRLVPTEDKSSTTGATAAAPLVAPNTSNTVTFSFPRLPTAEITPASTSSSPSLGLEGSSVPVSASAPNSVVTSQATTAKIVSASPKSKPLLDRLTESQHMPPITKSTSPDMSNGSAPAAITPVSLPTATASTSYTQTAHLLGPPAVLVGAAPASPILVSSVVPSPSIKPSAVAGYYTKLTSLANEVALWGEISIIRKRFEEEHKELQQRQEETVRAAERQKEQMDRVLHLANSMFEKYGKIREFQDPRWKEERLQAEIALQAAQGNAVAVTPTEPQSQIASPIVAAPSVPVSMAAFVTGVTSTSSPSGARLAMSAVPTSVALAGRPETDLVPVNVKAEAMRRQQELEECTRRELLAVEARRKQELAERQRREAEEVETAARKRQELAERAKREAEEAEARKKQEFEEAEQRRRELLEAAKREQKEAEARRQQEILKQRQREEEARRLQEAEDIERIQREREEEERKKCELEEAERKKRELEEEERKKHELEHRQALEAARARRTAIEQKKREDEENRARQARFKAMHEEFQAKKKADGERAALEKKQQLEERLQKKKPAANDTPSGELSLPAVTCVTSSDNSTSDISFKLPQPFASTTLSMGTTHQGAHLSSSVPFASLPPPAKLPAHAKSQELLAGKPHVKQENPDGDSIFATQHMAGADSKANITQMSAAHSGIHSPQSSGINAATARPNVALVSQSRPSHTTTTTRSVALPAKSQVSEIVKGENNKPKQAQLPTSDYSVRDVNRSSLQQGQVSMSGTAGTGVSMSPTLAAPAALPLPPGPHSAASSRPLPPPLATSSKQATIHDFTFSSDENAMVNDPRIPEYMHVPRSPTPEEERRARSHSDFYSPPPQPHFGERGRDRGYVSPQLKRPREDGPEPPYPSKRRARPSGSTSTHSSPRQRRLPVPDARYDRETTPPPPEGYYDRRPPSPQYYERGRPPVSTNEYPRYEERRAADSRILPRLPNLGYPSSERDVSLEHSQNDPVVGSKKTDHQHSGHSGDLLSRISEGKKTAQERSLTARKPKSNGRQQQSPSQPPKRGAGAKRGGGRNPAFGRSIQGSGNRNVPLEQRITVA